MVRRAIGPIRGLPSAVGDQARFPFVGDPGAPTVENKRGGFFVNGCDIGVPKLIAGAAFPRRQRGVTVGGPREGTDEALGYLARHHGLRVLATSAFAADDREEPPLVVENLSSTTTINYLYASPVTSGRSGGRPVRPRGHRLGGDSRGAVIDNGTVSAITT